MRSRMGLIVVADNRTCDVNVLESLGRYLRLGSDSRLTPGTAVQWQVDGQVHRGQVIVCVPRESRFEMWLEAKQPTHQQRNPIPSWRAEGAPDSVLDGLLKLNSRLMSFHQDRNPGTKPGSGNSGTIHS